MTRIISATFVMMALAVFKPFGLDAWQWRAYVHLAAIWVIGLATCMATDLLLKYVVRMPRSMKKGVGYIIRRNLWFQLINTPLVAFFICLYRHFVMSGRVESNQFSLVNYLETLVIIAFCSFAIGLYWRFKFRSRFLAAELEETRLLNEQLRALTSPSAKSSRPTPSSEGGAGSTTVTLTGTTNESVTLDVSNLLYIEAVGNYAEVLQRRDGKVRTDMLRSTLKQMEEKLLPYPMIVRCHRVFLVNLAQVGQIVSRAGSMQLVISENHDSIPVSRSNMAAVKEAIAQG